MKKSRDWKKWYWDQHNSYYTPLPPSPPSLTIPNKSNPTLSNPNLIHSQIQTHSQNYVPVYTIMKNKSSKETFLNIVKQNTTVSTSGILKYFLFFNYH